MFQLKYARYNDRNIEGLLDFKDCVHADYKQQGKEERLEYHARQKSRKRP